ncbi:hypothetical protein PSTG_18055, partial [Puccinia striiformis f. sp. tritici PST-78]
MHNLLLGLFKWHTIRFWAISNKQDSEDDQPDAVISATELLEMSASVISDPQLEEAEPHEQQSPQEENDNDLTHDGLPFFREEYGSNTSPGDHDWAASENDGWDGIWLAGEDSCIFDSGMLKQINSLLPRIRYPSWIKRAIPVLGQASYGKLKADEWRNLFLMQLPLVLVKIWGGVDRVQRSLLQNFGHLVSAVDLALRRNMNARRIDSYRHHIKEYLNSCQILFPHVDLAPNHHLSMHLADCLERFGPVRAWWSFPMERLMGQVLHSCHNNHIGQLEITFMREFCRA